MGLIARVDTYASKSCIFLIYPQNRRVFFSGMGPGMGTLVTLLELPEHDIILRGSWRKTVLDDFLEHKSQVHGLKEGDFGFQDYAEFVDRAYQHKKEGYVSSLRSRDLEELQKALDFEEKLRVVANSLPGIVRAYLGEEKKKKLYRGDSPFLASLKDATVEIIPRLFRELKSQKGIKEGSNILLDRFTDKNASLTAAGIILFENLAKSREHLLSRIDLRNIKVTLPGNVTGREIDITRAHEIRSVQVQEQFFTGLRVGSVSGGRPALQVSEESKEQGMKERIHYYIQGDKSLRFRVLRAGGRLEFAGNVLKIDMGEIRKMLLQIEELDALACLNPGAVIDRLIKNKAKEETIRIVTQEAAKEDYDYKKIANLAIHKLYRLDPELARKMYRQFT